MRLSSLMSVACCPEGGKGEGSLNYEGSESNVQCSNDKKNEWCNFVIKRERGYTGSMRGGELMKRKPFEAMLDVMSVGVRCMCGLGVTWVGCYVDCI